MKIYFCDSIFSYILCCFKYTNLYQYDDSSDDDIINNNSDSSDSKYD